MSHNNSPSWQQGYFTVSDGVRLFYRLYLPDSAKQALIILHGFGEHSFRYEKFSQHFPELGIALFDMRGMGRSEGERVYVKSFEVFERDALEFFEFLNTKIPQHLPRTILGHSLGGLNLMRLCVRHSLQAKRFIFSAPCFRIAGPEIIFSVSRFIDSVWPRFVYKNPVYYYNLTHDPVETQSYKDDTLIMRQMTAHLLGEMISAGESIQALSEIHLQSPVHFLLAGDDKIVRTDIAEKVYQKISAPEKSLNIYQGFFHEIFNETGQLDVFRDLRKILG